MKLKPVLVESDEWLYMGCFIQKNNHPKLLKYSVFEEPGFQTTVGSSHTFSEAKKLAENNFKSLNKQ